MMERIRLNDDLEPSRIVDGMWRLTRDSKTGAAHVQAKTEACPEQEVTSFDRADICGEYESQPDLGTALKAAPALRDRIEIVTKCDITLVSDRFPKRWIRHYDCRRAHIAAPADRSLTQMNINRGTWIELYSSANRFEVP